MGDEKDYLPLVSQTGKASCVGGTQVRTQTQNRFISNVRRHSGGVFFVPFCPVSENYEIGEHTEREGGKRKRKTQM